MNRTSPLALVAAAAAAVLGGQPILEADKLQQLRAAGGPPRRGKQKGRQTKGAFGKATKKKAAKETFLRESSRQAKTIANAHSLKQAYAKWRRDMSPEELAIARKLKVHFPAGDGGEFRRPRQGQVDLDFHDPADLPESAVDHHPVDDIEPQSPFAVAIEALDSQEITAAADCFSEVLTWALDVPDQRDLVGIGMRAMVVISALHEELLGEFRWPANTRAVHHDFATKVDLTDAQLRATGEIFGRVLEWVRRGSLVSEIGERLCLVAYVVRPTMMNSPTLEQLGEVMNKTRQAKDKLVSCLRDTFAGLKAVAQRGEATRLVCQSAH